MYIDIRITLKSIRTCRVMYTHNHRYIYIYIYIYKYICAAAALFATRVMVFGVSLMIGLLEAVEDCRISGSVPNLT